MDLSGVELYESQAVADGGAQAVAQGRRIGFAPGALDFGSRQGQALLGHELSHLRSQALGQARGQGFLQDAALERQADREGALAAGGQMAASVTPLSGATPLALSPATPCRPRNRRRHKKMHKNGSWRTGCKASGWRRIATHRTRRIATHGPRQTVTASSRTGPSRRTGRPFRARLPK